MADLTQIVSWLNEQLEIATWNDFAGACNGLQVDSGQSSVQKVGVAVDACLATIQSAATAKVDLLLVHHGMLWPSRQALVGEHGAMVRLLIENKIALYSAHLPLDAHPKLGNNAVIAAKLGLSDLRAFGLYEGQTIGWGGDWLGSADDLASKITAITDSQVIGNPIAVSNNILQVAVVSGGAGDYWQQADLAGYDVLLTGEARHQEQVAAAQAGFGLWTAGHYATETFGVAALGESLAQSFSVDCTQVGAPPVDTMM